LLFSAVITGVNTWFACNVKVIDDNLKKVICKLVFTDSKLKLIIENNEYLLSSVDDVLKYRLELQNRTLTLLE